MTTFEQRLSAWLDGELSGAELAAFEKELDRHPEALEALEDETETTKLHKLLQTHSAPPELRNPDFFNTQLMAKIAAETKQESKPARRTFFWSLPNLGWAAACCLLLSYSVYKTFVPATPAASGPAFADLVTAPTPPVVIPEPAYQAQIVTAESGDPSISVTPVHSDRDKVTVLWVDGLDYLPASYNLK